MTLTPPPPDFKTPLSQALTTVRSVILDLATLLPGSWSQAEHWLTRLEGIRAHLEEDFCRVAVVGTVKSGKSTLINALLGQDVLKRGAGIVTAMITRVQPAAEPRALLIFKNWEEINGEINRALTFFPSPLLREQRVPLDLREARDRELLTQVLAQVDQDRVLQQDTLDQNYVLLASYVEGYPALQAQLAAGAGALELEAARLRQHQNLVSQEAQAVYLKDVLLRLPFPWPVAGLEVGDCQGSDSPIPQHLGQVQNYLLKTDLLVYVISSRVGLRRADYKFLGDLNRMRSWDQVLFVVNLDLDEFDRLDAVQDLMARLSREIQRLFPGAPIYSLSALDLLLGRLQARGFPLSPKDQGKLAAWEADQDIIGYARGEASRFEGELQQLVAAHHTRLLLSGCLGQLRAVTHSLGEGARLQQELLGQDLAAFEQVKKRLIARRRPLDGVLQALRSALKGVSEDLKKALRKNSDAFFDARHGEVGRSIAQFIDRYQVDLTQMDLGDKLTAFMPGLYLLYQNFQRQLLSYLTEEINVRILEFVRQQDEWLADQVNRLISPLATTLEDAASRYYEETQALGITVTAPTLGAIPWQPPKDLQPTLFTLELGLSWKVRREAIMRLGFNLVTETIDRLRAWWSKQPAAEKRHRLIHSLVGALDSIKKTTKQDLADALLDFGEGMKFRYFFPLVDHLVKEQEEAWATALGALFLDLESLQDVISQQEEHKQERRQRLAEVVQRIQRLGVECDHLWAQAQSVTP